MLPVKRSKKTTFRQYEIMLDFLENHPEMISGKLTDSFTAQRREELWTELSVFLNSVHFGPQKTPIKWKRTWIDIKSETKQRAKEAIEQSHLRGSLNLPPLPAHLARIRSLLGLSNIIYYKSIEERNCTDQSPIKIKECFTEEMTPDSDMLNNDHTEIDDKASPTIKIENVSDILSTPENTCFENGCDIPSTSTESPCDNVSDILTLSDTPCEKVSNISTCAESSCEDISDNLSTSIKVPCKEVSKIPSANSKTPFENALDTLRAISETSSKKCSVNISRLNKTSCDSRPKKTTCEKVCDILTTSVKKLNDVVKNSENRTITALNALTEATVRANELHEKQLQIEKERNRLYQERNEILSTLVNAFVEKKVNHQY